MATGDDTFTALRKGDAAAVTTLAFNPRFRPLPARGTQLCSNDDFFLLTCTRPSVLGPATTQSCQGVSENVPFFPAHFAVLPVTPLGAPYFHLPGARLGVGTTLALVAVWHTGAHARVVLAAQDLRQTGRAMDDSVYVRKANIRQQLGDDPLGHGRKVPFRAFAQNFIEL